MSEEQYPTSEKLTVLDGVTINKDNKWWSAVLKYTTEWSKKPQFAVYLWINRGGTWKRQEKFIILPDVWPKIRETIEKMLTLQSGLYEADS